MPQTIVGTTALTLQDWAARQGDDGKTALIVDLLSQTNEMMDDMLWVEANTVDGHVTSIRTGIPTGTWRSLYQGVMPTKTTNAKVKEAIGNYEGYSEVDKTLADLNGNAPEFRMTEDSGFYEGMTQDMQGAFLYESTRVNPDRILGLSPRYNTLSTSKAQSAANVMDMGGTANTNTSAWFVQWGVNTCHGLFPKGATAGLSMRDLGEDTKRLADGSLYQVYISHFKWQPGLCVRDWRYVTRMANIDVTQLTAGGSGTSANLINGFISALAHWPTAPRTATLAPDPTKPSGVVGGGRGAIYANRTVTTFMSLQATSKTNVLLKMEEFAGMVVPTFRGIPIRTVDRLLSTEAQVTT
jgi:hypothetical protein